ncbi:MAG: hypothetical protein ACK5MQ_09745, partial [Pikeienuella sp.]
MKRAVFAAISAAILLAAPVAGAATVNVDSYASGYYQNTGATPGAGSTNIIEDSTRNNYFAFDLSGITGKVTGAKLTLPGGNGRYFLYGGAPSAIEYAIRDVSTDIDALTGHAGGAGAFADLGSG